MIPSIVYTLLLIATILYLSRKKHEDEPKLLLKILGYFILASFAFIVNEVPLPLGFLLYLLFFRRPKLNCSIKRQAALIGLLTFLLVHWILPFAIHEWDSRAHYVEQELGSIYSLDFEEQQQLIISELQLKDGPFKVENFNVTYVKDGTIADISWQLLSQTDNRIIRYDIHYDDDKRKYKVNKSEHDIWMQYDRLASADRLFKHLNMLAIEQLTDKKGEHPYYQIVCTGERASFNIQDESYLFLSDGETKQISTDQLPLDYFFISTFAMKQIEQQTNKQGQVIYESLEGTERVHYLFEAY